MSGLVGVVALYRLIYPPKARVPPGLPILKLSSLPGKAGEAADAEAYVRNGAEVVQKGYDPVCFATKHPLLVQSFFQMGLVNSIAAKARAFSCTSLMD